SQIDLQLSKTRKSSSRRGLPRAKTTVRYCGASAAIRGSTARESLGSLLLSSFRPWSVPVELARPTCDGEPFRAVLPSSYWQSRALWQLGWSEGKDSTVRSVRLGCSGGQRGCPISWIKHTCLPPMARPRGRSLSFPARQDSCGCGLGESRSCQCNTC